MVVIIYSIKLASQTELHLQLVSCLLEVQHALQLYRSKVTQVSGKQAADRHCWHTVYDMVQGILEMRPAICIGLCSATKGK